MRTISSPFMCFCHAQPQLSRPRIEDNRHIEVGPTDLHFLGHRHPARHPDLAHLAVQPHAHLVPPHDALARLQADRLQAGSEPPFFQAA